ncbi:MAG TPA: hypothetical protein VJJ23_06455 [Candidatus Nanoarchaeia archaeon]|nr:hypothetical protein [Candidatus Nanoarchaeia archaeon]
MSKLKNSVLTVAIIIVLIKLIGTLLNIFGVSKFNYLIWGFLNLTIPAWIEFLWTLIGLIILIIIAIPKIQKKILNGLENSRIIDSLFAKRNIKGYILVAFTFFIIFFLFQIVNYGLGDAGILPKEAFTIPASRFFMSSPISSYSDYLFYKVTSPIAGWEPVKSTSFFVNIIGFFFIILLFLLSNLLGKDKIERFFVFMFIGSMGTIEFFFGWWEGTSRLAFTMFLYILVSIYYLKKNTKLIYPTIAMWLSFWSHLAAFWILPSLLYLYFVDSGIKKLNINNFFKGVFNIKFIRFIAPFVILTILFFVYIEFNLYTSFGIHVTDIEKVKVGNTFGGGDGIMFLPLFEYKSPWEKYMMISFEHFTYSFNENILAAGVGLLLFVLLFLTHRKKINFKDNVVMFLLIMLSFFFLFTITLNIEYQEKLGWDLFSPAAFIYGILSAYVLLNYVNKDVARQVFLIMIISNIIFTVPWVLSNSWLFIR